jgi:hypothetical protein
MRRTAAILALVLIAVSLAACGGDTAATNATSSTPAPGSVAPPPAAVPAASSDSKSPTETVSNEQFPTAADGVPKVVLDMLKNKQPILLFFYDSTQLITSEQRAEVDAVIARYRGLIELVAYDIRSESVSVGAANDPEVQKSLDLAGTLGVKHTPYVLLVDRYGRVTGRFAGYVDRVLIEREVLRATQ